jgi:hypothetical protein
MRRAGISNGDQTQGHSRASIGRDGRDQWEQHAERKDGYQAEHSKLPGEYYGELSKLKWDARSRGA